MEPGPGFFDLAEALGYEVPNRTLFWIAQVKHVFKAWAR